jgi:tetratricopeptide (TPR) repeat protein
LLIGFSAAVQAQNFFQLVKRGLQRMAAKNYKGAIEDFTQALELTPDDINLFLNRGFIKSLSGDEEGAVEDYNKSIVYNPKNASAWFNQAIQIDPNYGDIYSNRGILKQPSGGCADLQKAAAMVFCGNYSARKVM